MQVIFKFKTDEFYRGVNKLLNIDKIEYSYKQIELIYNKDNVINELSLLELKKHKKDLNDKVIDTINVNAKNTYDKNIKEYGVKLDEFLYSDHILGKQYESRFKMFKHKDDYTDIQLELAEWLIRID